MKSYNLLLLLIFIISCKKSKTESEQQVRSDNSKPNIVIIYLDDLGYGDVSAYGATELETPNIDALAGEGIKFTNGYASSATCTPSRYALLTGIYPWRNEKAKILPGTAPLLIDTMQLTLPKLLKNKGYNTAIIGKWHLGLGEGMINWNGHISPGPNEVGFEESYILAATQDRVPTVYIQNGNVVGLDSEDPIEVDYLNNIDDEPTALSHPELVEMKWHHGHNNSIVNGIPRIGYMKGGESAKWSDEDMADHFLKKAQDYVASHKDNPFFLYYAMQQPHVPRTPHPRFKGKSGLGPRGDVILEADWCVGEFMKTLQKEGLLENTLIIFSSDNGPVLNDGYYDDAVEKVGRHDPMGGLRGGKYSIFEAGTRVPFITYWKGKIEPSVSDALVCQMDILSSVAELLGIKVESKEMDSTNLLNTLLGKSRQGRDHLILEATGKTALRSGDWVYIPAYAGRNFREEVGIEVGNLSEEQLYNLSEDQGQQNNLAKTNPEKLEELKSIFLKLRGEDYKNDVKEVVFK
ncbi:sulfatase family protein [Leeuwenhoekiella parthenopeia]|uniref:Arylsulfatase n=1 Tax=Leeuwenhoekiella parthenopeia TaxID=2890320 RepID=A0ABS8GR40_9FLAO|nr:arylsulfatase [Leeuwenhoekiella parthenopeia]MCC4211993.1 arylsulfatase [Leeuwenhoekiella parthenopeia]